MRARLSTQRACRTEARTRSLRGDAPLATGPSVKRIPVLGVPGAPHYFTTKPNTLQIKSNLLATRGSLTCLRAAAPCAICAVPPPPSPSQCEYTKCGGPPCPASPATRSAANY